MRPLHGRSAEVSALRELSTALARGTGGVLVIEGAAGLGKSRLLAEAAELASRQGIRSVAGAADELDQVSPWLALTRAFDSGSSEALDASFLATAEGLLDHRLAVIERMRAALEHASLERPLLVILDDLQWADPATLLALAVLPEQLFSYPICWVVAHRPVPEAHTVREAMERLRAGGAGTLRLTALDHEAVLQIAEDVLDRPADDDVSRSLAAAGGNPFYVVEMLRPGSASSSAEVSGATGLDHVLSGTLSSHLRDLDERVRLLLKLGSVLGREFSVTEIAAMSGERASQWLGAVERALSAEVLVESRDQLAFRHDLLREAVYEEIPEGARKALHRDAGRALQGLGASVTRMAGHFVRGAEVGDEQAIGVLSSALGTLAPKAPGVAAELAMRLVELIPEGDQRHARMAATAVGVLGWAGWAEEARTLGEALLAGGSAPATLEAVIQLGMRRAWAQKMLTKYPTPVPARLIADARIPPGTRACLLAQETWEPMEQARFATVEEILDRALVLVQQAADDTEVAAVLSHWVTSDTFQGEVCRGLRRIEEGLPGTLPLTAPVSVGTIECLRAQNLRALGRLDDAQEALTRGVAAGERSGVMHTICWAGVIKARLLYDRGRLDDATTEAQEAAVIGERFGHVEYAAAARALTVEIAVLQGQRPVADEAAAALSRTAHFSPTMSDRHWALALGREARGGSASALEVLEPVLTQIRRGMLVFARWNIDRLPRIVRLAIRAGDSGTAVMVAEAAADYARRNADSPILKALAAHAMGLAQADESALRRAVSGLAGSPLLLAEATAREDLGLALSTTGAVAEAVEQLELALAGYTTASAHHEAARARGHLYRLGVRRRRRQPARPTTGWASLTPSERNVVEIVAQGLTNRAAAAQLYLSPDTVNTHLRHAFGKLGVRSRVELTRLVLEREAGAVEPAPAAGP